MMTATFATIVLNAMPWIRYWLIQHYRFADQIVIVEGADSRYPSDRVTADGLSTDGTAEAILSFPDPDKKIRLIQHGWVSDKAELRDVYARVTRPGILAVPDSDEFIDEATWHNIRHKFTTRPDLLAYTIPIIHFWQPPGSTWPEGWPRSRTIITGSYADCPHTRFYRVTGPIQYRGNHNQPEFPDGRELVLVSGHRYDRKLTTGKLVRHLPPFSWHYGFCISADNGRDKNVLYLNRGEATTRVQTTQFRGAWLRGETPADANLHFWDGGWPDCFNHEAFLCG